MGGLREDGRGGETYQVGTYAGGPLVQDRLGLSLFAESKARANTPQETNERLSDLEDRETLTGSATLSWTPDTAQRIDLTVLAGRDDRYRDTVSTGARPVYYRYADTVDRRQYALSHTGQWGWGETVVRAYRSTLDRENAVTAGQTASRPIGMQEDILDGRATFDRLAGHRVSVGGKWRREKLEDPAASKSGELDGERYALRTFKEAGAGAVHLEDHILPKKCGHLNGKALVPALDMAAKVAAAKKASRDIVIMARTDAAGVEGFDAAVDRAKMYVDAGADCIFPEALNTREMFEKFAKAMPGVPLLANMTEFGKTPFYTAAEFEEMGYKMVIWPVSSLRAANKAQE